MANPTPTTAEYPPDAPLFPIQEAAVIMPRPSELERIHTERLVLRPLRTESDVDAAGVFRIRGRQDVIDWLWPRIPDAGPEDTKKWARKKVFPTPDGAGAVGDRLFYFVVTRKGDADSDSPESIIGAVGVNSLDPAPSVGYSFHPDVWGKGYATEAVRAVVGAWWDLPRAWSFEEEKLYAGVNCANVGSVRVLEKVGFEVYEYVQYDDRLAFMCMGRPRKQ
ncbi:GNAT family N-acetyltransferase [Aspergillus lucknowensis]|uniref:GNAT domain-containing protein n=1 Tax=Aspergillus lucknowensis TaxID=176173 RepID=A0ABR4L5V6_9EURO